MLYFFRPETRLQTYFESSLAFLLSNEKVDPSSAQDENEPRCLNQVSESVRLRLKYQVNIHRYVEPNQLGVLEIEILGNVAIV